MYKPVEFMARLARYGEDVQVFEHALLLKPESISIGDKTRLDDYCRIEGGEGVEIGPRIHISSFCSIFGGGRALLGDMCGMSQGSRVITGSEQVTGAMNPVSPAEWRDVMTTTVVLDHLSFLATNAVVLPGASLGFGSVAAAGSVINKPVPAWEIWAGVPAKAIGRRDRDVLIERGMPIEELEAQSLLSNA
ncbi:MAG TPA: acyltransferase [Thermoleophilaceae bacterium]|nr:acyltransferase [Thermoleophilaceae bacterium]